MYNIYYALTLEIRQQQFSAKTKNANFNEYIIPQEIEN